MKTPEEIGAIADNIGIDPIDDNILTFVTKDDEEVTLSEYEPQVVFEAYFDKDLLALLGIGREDVKALEKAVNDRIITATVEFMCA